LEVEINAALLSGAPENWPFEPLVHKINLLIAPGQRLAGAIG
jgi:hypothetical protein